MSNRKVTELPTHTSPAATDWLHIIDNSEADPADRNKKVAFGGTGSAIDVTNYGALGNGSTDDTTAILAARDAAESADAPLYFPPCSVAYMISRGILLSKSTVVLGSVDGPIKKITAVTSDVDGAVSVDDTVIPVDDTSGFVVGYDVYVGKNTTETSNNGSRGIITAISSGAPGTVTVNFYTKASGGLSFAHADGTAVLSQTFPIIYTSKVVSGATEISPEIIGVHLNGNKQAGEPDGYTISLIHFDSQHVTAPFTSRCELRDSPADAISDQGDGYGVHEYNRMYDNANHGIHLGTTQTNTKVIGNYADGNGSDGVYYCFANTNCYASGNYFENMPWGFKEIGDQNDTDCLLIGNTTKNCDVDYQVGNAATGTISILDILSIGSNNHVLIADLASGLTITGTAHSGAGIGVEFRRCSESVCNVNFTDWTGTICVNVINFGGTYATGRSKHCSVFGNMEGATGASVRVRSSDNCFIAPSVSQPAGAAPDVILDDQTGSFPAQTACENTILGAGFRKTGITETSATGTRDLMNRIVRTLADDATPTVAGAGLFKTGGTTTITDFDDGIVGDTINILAAHSLDITDNAAIILNGGANYSMTATDTLTLTMFDDQVWQETSRSVN